MEINEFIKATLEEIYQLFNQYTPERPVLCCSHDYLKILAPYSEVAQNEEFTGFAGLYKAVPIFVISKEFKEVMDQMIPQE